MNYKKLIGWSINTNQFTSPIIENALEAKHYIDKAVELYGDQILDYIYMTSNKRFSAYAPASEFTLRDFLND